MSPENTIAQPSLSLITDTAAYDDLRREWIELWNRAPDAAVFQRPEWLIPWWHHFGDGKAMRVVQLRIENRLIALLPLAVLRQPDLSHELQLIGTGNTDRLDAIIDPAFRNAAVDAFSAWLEHSQDEWDRCVLAQIPAGSALLQLRPPESVSQRLTPAEPCPVLRLDGSVRPGVHAGPRRHRYYKRRAVREGARIIESTRADLRELLDALFALHAARWRERGEAGVLADPAVQAFLHDACTELAAGGMLRLIGMEHHDRLVGLCLSFFVRGRNSAYIGGFDPEYSRMNPGTVLIGRLVEHAVENGEVIDFLRGREQFKYDWGAVDEVLWTCTFTRRCLVDSGDRVQP